MSAPPVRGLAVIVNPFRQSNGHAALPGADRIFWAQPRTPQALADALKQIADRRIRTIAIDGGDGTVRDVLSAAVDVYDGHGIPEIVLLPSGETNVIAADVGSPGRGAAAMRRLLSALDGSGAPLRYVERPLLEIRPVSGNGATVRGFFFGAATFTHVTRQSLRRRRPDPVAGLLSIAPFVAASFLRGLLPGKHRSLWSAGEALTLSVDGRRPPQADRHFLVLATTLRRLVFRLWPFWGTGSGALRWLDIDAPPKHLVRAAGRVVSGRPAPWMLAAGYRSGTAERLRIELTTPFVCDGDLFDAGRGGIELSAGPTIRFLAP